MHNLLDVNYILHPGGLIAVLIVAAILFAETGMLVGFFLPGDTLLIAAGVLAAEHKLPLVIFLPVAAIAAILGYQVGYKIGEKAGPRFFKRKDGLLFRQDYIERTERFFHRHGGKSILLARFVAVVRTIVPLTAGIGKMDKRRFFFYNLTGGILWIFSVTLASYWVSQKLGKRIPNLDKYLIYLLVLAMLVTVGGVIFGIIRNAGQRRAFKNALREEYNYFFKKGP